MEMKPFRLDGGAMAVDAGRDMHLEARVAGGARHRQAMGDEIPILGHEIDDREAPPSPSALRARPLLASGIAADSSATAPMM